MAMVSLKNLVTNNSIDPEQIVTLQLLPDGAKFLTQKAKLLANKYYKPMCLKELFGTDVATPEWMQDNQLLYTFAIACVDGEFRALRLYHISVK